MNAWKTALGASFCSLAILVSPGKALDECCVVYDPCLPPPCAPLVCTVLVPQTVTEYRTQTVTRYRPEVRERMVTVYRQVPATETIEEEFVVMVPETRTRTVTDTINTPVYGDIQLRVTKMASQVEPRQRTQTVTRMISVHEMRCEPGCPQPAAPGWPTIAPNEQAIDAPPPPPSPDAAPPQTTYVSGGACGGCAPRTVCITTWKPVSQDVTVQYAVTHLEPSSRLRPVSFYEYKTETQDREEQYVVDVPQIRTRTREIAVTRTIADQQPERYTEMVPYQEKIQVPIVTRRYVEQPVIVR